MDTDRKQNPVLRVLRALWKPVLAALLLAVFLLALQSPKRFYQPVIQSVDVKKENVKKLLASTTAASAAITMIPDDAGTPIAEQLVNLGHYFIIILSTLYLEQYLMPVLGTAAPVLGLAGLALLYCLPFSRRKRRLKRIACHLLVLCFTLPALIPASIVVSNGVEALYQDTIRETMEKAAAIEEAVKEAEGDEKGFWAAVTRNAKKVVSAFSGAVEWTKNALNEYIEAITIILVTDCVIPLLTILTLLIVVWRGVKALDDDPRVYVLADPEQAPRKTEASLH